jgi:hypothetical protein
MPSARARPWNVDGDNSILKSKSEAGDAQREICADFAHHRNRLQHRRSPRSVDESLCAHARTKGDLCAHTDVVTGERPPSMIPRSCQNFQVMMPPAVNPTSKPNLVIVPE